MWCFLLRCVLCFPGLLCTLPAATHQPLHEYSDGDVIIGGLFPIHLQPNRTFPSSRHVSCNEYHFQQFLAAQMMIFAIKRVNQRRALPNVTLGYDVYDTCGDVSLAMRMALNMSIDQLDPQCGLLPGRKPSSAPDPRVKAVIGEGSSEVSIAVARILTLSSIAQISYAATSELLSKKAKFPTFLRTVNSDVLQTKAMAELVKTFNWWTVGIVGSDDEYGKYGSDGLVDRFNAMDNVCVDFKFILPAHLDLSGSNAQKQLTELMDTIGNSTAEAIILFTRESNVKLVLEAAIQRNLNRTWIASDTWSNSSDIKELPGIEAIGPFFGIAFKSHIVEGFADYVSSMVEEKSSNPLWEYHKLNHPPCQSAPQEKLNCSLTASQCMETRCLVHYIFWDLSLNIYLAVEVIVNALSSLMKCDREKCQRNTSFTAYELLNEIKNVNLTVNDTHIVFDDNGDPMLGYDIVAWNSPSSGTIGEYLPGGKINLPPSLVATMANVTFTAFNCSKTCPVGQELMKNGMKCCKHCIVCSEGYVSSEIGTQNCTKCEEGEYSSWERDKCLVKEHEFLKWKNPFITTLSIFNIMGIVATVVVGVILVVNRGTPIVKAVGGYLCFLELFSLLACFCLSFTFIVKPSPLSCSTGMPLFGIAFTLCVSCVLANLLQILVCFTFSQNMGGWLRKVNQPPAVVAILFGVQLVLCTIWLACFPPSLQREPHKKAFELKCDPTSKALFGAVLSYVALLAIVSFLFAFKGKKLPDLYKNASFVTIGMLLVLVVWIIFIPVYLFGDGVYTEAIKAAAVLVSSHSMLCCHLVPKCYIMVFRKELNDEKAITDYIRNHFDQKGINVLKS
ncbi:G-protein coupled receptor family C group 6 member A-like [Gadus macrocephalus]|uniref:G-protein coupled receptor family C group 6 member A-like n=1 Tax=Gadus macrocephalus TaxID=80720 RepID=UPI0028CB53F9|nr:G-protein coupled receptor family C group 6 member A-like [Gadus macrocephalus]